MGIAFDKPLVFTLDARTLEDPAAFQKAYVQVCPARRKKVDHCRFPKDKQLCLGAGLLLEQGLKQLGILNAVIALKESGKPYIANHPGLHFNLSHSGHYAVCAFYHKEVGIDVEEITPVRDALIHKIATDAEACYLLSLPQAEKEEAFFKLWTAKESYLKYAGCGLLVSPRRLSRQDNKLLLDGQPTDVTLEETKLPGHTMSLCY